MSAESSRLYDEFLGHYDLNPALYNHAVEMLDVKFEEIGDIHAVRIAGVGVPVSPVVFNSMKFASELQKAPVKAEMELNRSIRGFKTYRLEEDDVLMLCDIAEEAMLRNLLWPFHLVTVKSHLENDQFLPLACMMEKTVLSVLDILDTFYDEMAANAYATEARRQSSLEEGKRAARYRAENAPIEVRGSIRRVGDHLEVYANARSTVTDGMINADLQVNELMANQSARREAFAAQKGPLERLESSLKAVRDSYVKEWHDCLEQMTPRIGKNLLRSTICGTYDPFRPHFKENATDLLRSATLDDDFEQIARFLRFYDHDFDELRGDITVCDLINGYVKTKQINTECFNYKFYCYFYEVEHAIFHDAFFNRIREKLKGQAKRLAEKAKANGLTPDRVNCERVLTSIYRFYGDIPGIDARRRNKLYDAIHYVFYDVYGDIEMRDSYDEKNEIPVFDWTPD